MNYISEHFFHLLTVGDMPQICEFSDRLRTRKLRGKKKNDISFILLLFHILFFIPKGPFFLEQVTYYTHKKNYPEQAGYGRDGYTESSTKWH